jgi:uncharacterized protein
MKFLLVLILVLVIAWGWRTTRKPAVRGRTQGTPQPPAPANIVACRQCGVHIPTSDSIVGTQGVYCSNAHREQAER